MVKPRTKLGIALLAGSALLASLVLTQSAGAGEDEADPTAPAGLGTAANVAMEVSGGFEARWRSHLNQR